LEPFYIQITVDPHPAGYRAYIVLWDGSLLERFRTTEAEAAADLGVALGDIMREAGIVPNARLLRVDESV
jgi:hypothetical protein